MKYKCLVLDHDDTVVNSTATVHFPAFSSLLKQIRPDVKMNLEEYFELNYDPGFSELCYKVLGFSEEEMQLQLENWQKFCAERVPKAYDGIKEIIEKFKLNGGKVCVVSHSFKKYILRDYEKNKLPLPDMIFGWDEPAEERKPNPYPLFKIMQTYNLSASRLVMVDDLKPGMVMANAAGVDFIGAGWAHEGQTVAETMKSSCKNFAAHVTDLNKYLF